MEYLRAAGAGLIAVVFAASSVSKLRDFRGFARSVPALVPMPPRWVPPVSVAVVVAEGASRSSWSSPGDRPGFVLASALLLAAFTTAIAASLRRGRRAPCRCFGAADTPVGPRHLARNTAAAPRRPRLRSRRSTCRRGRPGRRGGAGLVARPVRLAG